MQAERLTDDVTLYEGDCLEVLPLLESGSVDAVVTDPPYGVGFEYASHDDSREGYPEWCREWFAELKRVCTGTILISCGLGNIGMWYEIEPPKWVLCWHKPACMSRAVIGFNNWEPVLVYGKPPKNTCDVFQAPIVPDRGLNGHPCPKPLKWGVLQVRMMPQDAVILDPFAGSGTVLVAAQIVGRHAIGIEIDPAYCSVIRKRVAHASGTSPASLFAEDRT